VQRRSLTRLLGEINKKTDASSKIDAHIGVSTYLGNKPQTCRESTVFSDSGADLSRLFLHASVTSTDALNRRKGIPTNVSQAEPFRKR
jgi:hypothetical protein